jgi:hypothetical protein
MLGIQATDVLDKLFLARELHRRLPHLKFYTFESNALYLQPDYQDAMRGMLVFSSYSLTGDVTGSTTVDLFPSDAASGVYNATLIQLGHERLVRYDRGLGIPWNRPCPPVWVTVIGAGVVAPSGLSPGATQPTHSRRAPQHRFRRSPTNDCGPASCFSHCSLRSRGSRCYGFGGHGPTGAHLARPSSSLSLRTLPPRSASPESLPRFSSACATRSRE